MDTQTGADLETRSASGDSAAQRELARQLSKDGRHGAAAQWLRRAAAAGDIAATTLLAQLLLTQPPYSVPEAVAFARKGADSGDGEAAHLLAILAGLGLGLSQDWQSALAHLQRSAELGWAPAQAELRTLSGNADSAANWRSLRNSIDMDMWLTLPRLKIVPAGSRIAVAQGFAPTSICDWLIAKSRPQLKPALTYDVKTGTRIPDIVRNNSSFDINLALSDLILVLVQARIAALTRLTVGGMEATSVLHYAAGEEFFPHYDFLDISNPGHAKEIAECGGQRVLTFLLYLNDDYEGGETDFPYLGWRHKGRKGDAMFFWNVDLDGTPDRRTLHAGLPPSRGEKWLLSQWIRRPQPPSA